MSYAANRRLSDVDVRLLALAEHGYTFRPADAAEGLFDVLVDHLRVLRDPWRRVLEQVIPPTTAVLSRVFAVEGRGRDLFATAERLDLEGIVAQRKADPYAPSTVWYKIKNRAYT
jgi:ATP-dependent DNA ligase